MTSIQKTDTAKFSAFGGLDSLLSITEMPSGSPVVAVGVNKAGNAGIYAMKMLANEFADLKKKLKQHKLDQHNSVMKESDKLKTEGLSKFAKKNSNKINLKEKFSSHQRHLLQYELQQQNF